MSRQEPEHASLRQINPTIYTGMFEPGDKVVAVNTDCSRAIVPPKHDKNPVFHFPDGYLRGDVVYNIEQVEGLVAGGQGVYLTGFRVYWSGKEISLHQSRFRKVDKLKRHVPMKREQPLEKTKRVVHEPKPVKTLVEC